ncbi:MAG: TSUP family transporter, partial [Actinobacteria bacterium]|nr:TSUP family transporter [Actinomycetota bacterium]
MSMTLILTALASGAFIGAVLGFIGAGGAMVSVPIFLYLFDFTPIHATTAALAVVFLAAVAGLGPKFKSKDVLVKEALIIWALGLVTNIGFGLIITKIPDQFILFGFSFVLIGAGYSMLRAPIKDHAEKSMPFWALITLSLLIGSLTGLFGVGGGFLAIPVLVLFFHTPQNKAAGTSLLIIALNCITAFIAKHSIWTEINWHYPAVIALSAVIVSMLASKFA